MSTLFAEIAPDPLPSQGWPKNPKGLSSRLTTLAPSLRKVGIEVSATTEKEPGTRRTIWHVHKVPAQSFARFNPSNTGADQEKRGEGLDEGSDGGAHDPSPDPSGLAKDRSGQSFNPSQSFGLGTPSDLRFEGSKDLKDSAGTSQAPDHSTEAPSPSRVMALLEDQLGAQLIETVNGRAATDAKPDDRPRCIAPGCTAKARRACSTCPDHMEFEPRRRAS